MAKAKKGAVAKVRLMSEEGRGFFYVTKKNVRKKPEKLTLRKYNARLRRHVLFKESKI